MATVPPPPSKKLRRLAQNPQKDIEEIPADLPFVRVKFEAFDTGETLPGNLRVPGSASISQLELLLNQLLKSEESVPFDFQLKLPNSKEPIDISTDLYTDVLKQKLHSTEEVFSLVYTPRAVFKVKNITRSTGAASGHGSTILSIQFPPNTSKRVATGAGDCTARIWNAETQGPLKTLSGHADFVLVVSYSPDGKYLASASQDGSIRIWNAVTGEQFGKPLIGHNKYVTSLSWEPYHLANGTPRLASASRDTTVRVWAVDRGVCEYSMSGHTGSVSCVKWGGFGDIYTASHDKTIKVWNAENGSLRSTLTSHAHWVNSLSLSTEYALRTGGFDERDTSDEDAASLKAKAQEKFNRLASVGGEQKERLVTASDDFTMFLWEPRKQTKPLCRMTGHQKLVNFVSFSPDGRHIASCSFDNSVKLWDGHDGKFIASLRGHVAAVYQCAWSSDCRMLATCSKDTTLKIWDVKTRKLKSDLPGHQDEVYALDWSVDGQRICTGGKDKTIRFWSH